MMIINNFRVLQNYNIYVYTDILYTHTSDRIAILIKAINSDSLPWRRSHCWRDNNIINDRARQIFDVRTNFHILPTRVPRRSTVPSVYTYIIYKINIFLFPSHFFLFYYFMDVSDEGEKTTIKERKAKKRSREDPCRRRKPVLFFLSPYICPRIQF